MMNGPSLRGLILGLFVVLMLRVSSQTLSPKTNGLNVFLFRSVILLAASSCADGASSRSLIRVCMRCSIDGKLVFWKVTGRVLGVSPNISSKGECFLSACLRLLWTNSMRWIFFDQSVGYEVQKIDK